MRSGMNAQMGVRPEATYGVRAGAPTAHLPIVNESLTEEISRLESEGIVVGQRVLSSEQWAEGRVSISGDVGLELYQQGLYPVLLAMFGEVDTTGAEAPYTHVFTLGSLEDDSLTIELGKPETGSTAVRCFTYLGSVVTDWEIKASENEIATLGLTVAARELDLSQTLSTAAIVAGGARPFTFRHCTISLAGSEVKVKELTVSGSNGLDTDRRFNGSGLMDQPREAGLREVTGQLSGEFESLTQLNRYRDADEVAFQAEFAAGDATLTIDGNVRFDPDPTPVIEGRGLLQQSLPVKFLDTAPAENDAIAVTVTDDYDGGA